MRFAATLAAGRLYVSKIRPQPKPNFGLPFMSPTNIPATNNSSHSVAQPVFVPSPQPQSQDGQTPLTKAQAPKRHLLGMEIDALTMEGAVDQLWTWINDAPQTEGCRYVVTPNVDHAVLLQENEGLQAAYRDAHMVLADGFPVVMASKLLNQPVPERVAGSELVPRLFDVFNNYGDLKVFLLGAAEGVAEVAAQNMLQQWPKVQTVDLKMTKLNVPTS